MMPVLVASRPAGTSGPAGAGGPASWWRAAPPALRALAWRPVLLSFLVARVVVLTALSAAQLLGLSDPDVRTEGLLGWDADWYLAIADQGYTALPPEAARFFPLLPWLTRCVAPLVGGNHAVALLLISNAGALAFGLLLHRLALREGLSVRVADTAVWVLALAPAAFVNVMGYTEPVYGALVCGVLLAARDRRWVLVAVLGGAVGLLRPPGVVLSAVVLAAALPGLRSVRPRELLTRAAAVAAPAAGLATYLLWTRARYGDPLLPFREQVAPDLRGGAFVDPLPGAVQALRGLTVGSVQGAGLHVLWAAVALALLVLAARRLSPPLVVLGVLTLVLALTARSMTSFERYAGSAVPVLLAAAIAIGATRRRSVTLGAACAMLAAYAGMAFSHNYVP